MEETLQAPQSKTAFYIKRVFGAILLLALSAVFIYSAYTKCGISFDGFYIVDNSEAFTSFQWSFIDLGISSTMLAGILARVFIGLEFTLGFFLLFHIYLKQFTYKAILFMLGMFTIYLLLLIVKQGNTGNCGCFGDSVTMTPLQSIWKNVAMAAVTLVLMYLYPVKPYKGQEWISMVIGMAAFVIPFITMPMSGDNVPEAMHEAIDMSPLYAADSTKPNVELRTGKHIIAFMSLTCPHCRKAAFMLQVVHHQNPELSIYFVLSGSKTHEKSFFEETHSRNVPHVLYDDVEEFKKMAGDYVPAIFWVNNSIKEKKSNYFQLDPKLMKTWFSH